MPTKVSRAGVMESLCSGLSLEVSSPLRVVGPQVIPLASCRCTSHPLAQGLPSMLLCPCGLLPMGVPGPGSKKSQARLRRLSLWDSGTPRPWSCHLEAVWLSISYHPLWSSVSASVPELALIVITTTTGRGLTECPAPHQSTNTPMLLHLTS